MTATSCAIQIGNTACVAALSLACNVFVCQYSPKPKPLATKARIVAFPHSLNSIGVTCHGCKAVPKMLATTREAITPRAVNKTKIERDKNDKPTATTAPITKSKFACNPSCAC